MEKGFKQLILLNVCILIIFLTALFSNFLFELGYKAISVFICIAVYLNVTAIGVYLALKIDDEVENDN